MTGKILDLIGQSEDSDRFYGVTIGIVTNNQDEEGLGRVKVQLPRISDTDESYWARILTPMTGKAAGIYFLPESDDEVLVAFDQGDINFPYILGSLWNGKDKPPAKNEDGKNNQRLIKSRSGHQIILDDTKDAEKIIIQDATGKNEIVIDSKNNAMMLKVEKDLTIEAKGKISLKTSGGDLAIECNNLNIQAKQNCEIKADANCNLEASAGIGIKCLKGVVKINDGALEVT
ncbi:phage baseplate assembly protein V [Anabaena sp. UHCC 0399]|uniref:phage baseplate assembly protein V n=1 Tax=Anabaena sp. UHCC 0399 TaxID=3110238 RepID=UPI002B1F0988|nr:phage baseplate assembly protein V [Anabaena sp. UHCC 0399]MEA5567773.1 phage baseplate assembly protein V [Anabaena sp. UHCC 0399]